MWIWYVERSEGGSISRIVERARRSGIGTVYVKSGDGGSVWSQFTSSLVGALHRGGLDVCAWQFVYGDNPVAEAKVGAASVARGADCLVIDAEGEYEGKYAAADRYVRALRARIGESFPLSLAGFPYVDYHPAFPYSVFFGPGGAQYNQPQMYWKAIGTSVRTVFEHTFFYNRLWGKPVYPLGQTYGGVGRRGVQRFRRFAASYDGLQPSWWDWQETNTAGWRAARHHDPRPDRRLPPGLLQPDAEAWRPRRPCRLGPGAPALGGPVGPGHGSVRQADPRRGPGLPGIRRPPGRRRDRLADLEGPAPLPAGPLPLGGEEGDSSPRHRLRQPRYPASPPALRLDTRQGRRDRPRPQSLGPPPIPKIVRRAPGPSLGGVAQLVRAPACHAGGRGFESRRSRSIKLLLGWRSGTESRPAGIWW